MRKIILALTLAGIFVAPNLFAMKSPLEPGAEEASAKKQNLDVLSNGLSVESAHNIIFPYLCPNLDSEHLRHVPASLLKIKDLCNISGCNKACRQIFLRYLEQQINYMISYNPTNNTIRLNPTDGRDDVAAIVALKVLNTIRNPKKTWPQTFVALIPFTSKPKDPNAKFCQNQYLLLNEFLDGLNIQETEISILNAIKNNNLRALLWHIYTSADLNIQILNEHTPWSRTPLCEAIINGQINGQIEMIKALIAAGTNVNIQDNFDEAPLHWAIEYGHITIVKTLIAAGANINIQDKRLWAPLHLTIISGQTENIKALIAAGADVNIQDKYGGTPLHFAIKYGRTGTVKVLIAASAQVPGNLVEQIQAMGIDVPAEQIIDG